MTGSSSLRAGDDQRSDRVNEGSGFMRFAQIGPPSFSVCGRYDTRLLRARKVTTEEKLQKWVIQDDGLRCDGNIRHPMLPEQSREPATDPAVFKVVAKGPRYQASRLRVRTIDDLSLPIEIKHRQSTSSTDRPGHLGERTFGIGNMHEHAFQFDRHQRLRLRSEAPVHGNARPEIVALTWNVQRICEVILRWKRSRSIHNVW